LGLTAIQNIAVVCGRKRRFQHRVTAGFAVNVLYRTLVHAGTTVLLHKKGRCGFFALVTVLFLVEHRVGRKSVDRRAFLMKRILAVGGSAVLALIVMSTYQVVKAPSGLAVVKGGHAFAADMAPPPPPPPVGKGKAPVGKAPMGKGKAPISTKG
jgi:hypothetical protein